jgi:hypothetical protein
MIVPQSPGCNLRVTEEAVIKPTIICWFVRRISLERHIISILPCQFPPCILSEKCEVARKLTYCSVTTDTVMWSNSATTPNIREY